MKMMLRYFPIETYVLLLPSFVIIMFTASAKLSCTFHQMAMCRAIAPLRGGGTIWEAAYNVFAAIILLFGLYILATIGISARGRFKEMRLLARRYGKGFLFVFGTIYICSIAQGLVIRILFNSADPTRTASMSHMLMRMDHVFFRSYLPFHLNTVITSESISGIIMQSYFWMLPLVVASTFILPFKSTDLFRKFILSYFIAIIIAYPFWYAFPVIQPDSMYRLNILHAEIPPDIAQTLKEITFLPYMKEYFVRFEEAWIDEQGKWLSITNFPSMHAAWGIIIAISAIEMWTPLALLVIPWVLLELVGTIYSLQHYGVDTIFGVIIGFAALWCAKKLMTFDQRYFIDRYDIFASVSLFQRHQEKTVRWLDQQSLHRSK